MLRSALGLALIGTALSACASEGVELPLDVAAGDVVVAVSTVDGRTEVRALTAGAPIRVPSDTDRPIFTWVLRGDEHVDPAGAPLSAEALAAVVPRLLPDEAGNVGCGRCEAPTVRAPAVVHPGDSCPVPDFVAGAIWRPEGGAYRCLGAAGSRTCTPGDAEDDAAVREIRRQLRLDHPGACVCADPAATTPLAGLHIDPIGPPENPVPIYDYTRRPDGVIVGVSRAGVLRHDPATGTTEARALPDWPIQLRTLTALSDGAVLASGDLFNSGATDEQGYFRFREEAGELVGPERVSPTSPALAEQIRRLGGPDDDFPLYLIGGERTVTGVEPAMFACTENLACRQVDLTDCDRRLSFSRLRDAIALPNGFGLALGRNALFYRRPGEAPPLETPWRCDQPLETPIPALDPAGEAIDVDRVLGVGALGNRLFVCGRARVASCTPEFAVVLTATAGRDADPDWRVAFRGLPNSGCGRFLAREDRIGLDLWGARLVEFDGAGEVTFDGSLFDRYGPLDGLGGVYGVGDGLVVAEATENRAFVATASVAFQPIYGPGPRARAHFRAAVALEIGFVAFGEGPPVRVVPEEIGGRYVSARVTRLEDPTDTFARAWISDATLDDDGVPLVVGDLDGPFVARVRLSGPEVTAVERVAVPADMPAPRHVARLGDGRFVVLTQQTRAFLLAGEAWREVEIDWDVPGTEAVETRPSNPVDGCTGQEARLDLWRDLDATGGAAWAVGGQGLATRITLDGPDTAHAERFSVPMSTAVTTVDARCAGRPWIGGRGLTVDPAGLEQASLQLFGLETAEEPRRGEAPPEGFDPRRQSFEPIEEDAIFAVNVFDLRSGTPQAVLRDEARDGAEPMVVLESGYLYRPGSALEYLRVPFDPDLVLQGTDGYVLFGGDNGRLALGVPAARR